MQDKKTRICRILTQLAGQCYHDRVHVAIAVFACNILISQAAFEIVSYARAVILRDVISLTRAAAYTYPFGFLGQ